MEPLFDNLMRLIREWGDARNLTAPENLTGQTLKLVSEFGEIADAVHKNDPSMIKDGFGDCMVVSVMLGAHIGLDFNEVNAFATYGNKRNSDGTGPMAALGRFADSVAKKQLEIQRKELLQFVQDLVDCSGWFGYNFVECVSAAYDEIKDRKGVMYNGVFVKESDLKYETALADIMKSRQQVASPQ